MVVHDESFRDFFPAGAVRTGAGFSGAGWVLGGERHCVPGVPTLDPPAEQPGHLQEKSVKNPKRPATSYLRSG